MKEANRSGYEIRLDVLKLAEGIENCAYSREYDIALHTAEKNNTPPELPLDDQVNKTLATAERLYAFVADKGE
jgi:hypothetical protein